MKLRKEEISALGMVLNEAFLSFMNERATNNPHGFIAAQEIVAAYSSSLEYVMGSLDATGTKMNLH